jgi:hypothetical protein
MHDDVAAHLQSPSNRAAIMVAGFVTTLLILFKPLDAEFC